MVLCLSACSFAESLGRVSVSAVTNLPAPQIGDFGLGGQSSEVRPSRRKYTAPEVLEGDAYTDKADMYSLG